MTPQGQRTAAEAAPARPADRAPGAARAIDTISGSLTVDRRPSAVAEHAVMGIVTGGLTGPGLVIRRRMRDAVLFTAPPGVWAPIPDEGEVAVEPAPRAAALVRYRLVCRRWRWRHFVSSLALGVAVAAVVIAVAALGPRSLAWLALPAGLGSAFALHVAGWRDTRRRLRHRVETYFKNACYLKEM